MDKNSIKKILNIIIFLGIILLAVLYLHHNIYQNDDFCRAFFASNSIKQLILTADHGRYISWVVMKLVVHGSSILMHIHPQDNIYFAQAVKGLNFAVLFYLIGKIFYIKSKEKLVNPFLYLCVTLISLFLIPFNNFRVINFYNQHFSYILNLIFFYPALLIFGNYFVNKKLPEKKDVLKNCVWAFLLGISAHFNIVTFVGILIFTSIYLAIENRGRIKEFFGKGFDYKTYTPITLLVLGALCSICSKSFTQLFLYDRHPEGSRLLFMIKDFPEFTKQWFYYVFCQAPNNILIISIILIGLFLIIRMIKSNNYEQLRAIVLAFGVVFGAAFFNYSLLSCGRTFYDGHSYWLVHADIQLVTNFYFLTALVILISQLFEFITNKKNFCTISFLCVFLFFLTAYKKYEINYYDSIVKRIQMYEAEKASAFYAYKGYAYIILPKNDVLQSWIVEENDFHFNFYKIHGFVQPRNLFFVSEHIFLQNAKKDGLIFTKEEIMNTRFTDLLNKDFVLYGKKN